METMKYVSNLGFNYTIAKNYARSKVKVFRSKKKTNNNKKDSPGVFLKILILYIENNVIHKSSGIFVTSCLLRCHVTCVT